MIKPSFILALFVSGCGGELTPSNTSDTNDSASIIGENRDELVRDAKTLFKSLGSLPECTPANPATCEARAQRVLNAVPK